MLSLKVDYRLGGKPRYYLAEETENLMTIPPEIKKCVVFLLCNDKNGMRLMGTAFFVCVDLEEFKERNVAYLVTAKHVITAIKKISTDVDKKIFIKINLSKENKTQLLRSTAEQWIYHEDPSVDVAVLSWTPPEGVFDYLAIPIDMRLTDEIIESKKVGLGDEVFLTGLFHKFCGKSRNIPIIRVGNIAMMPDEKIFVGDDLGEIDAYLIEARSIGGLSGSPVFVYLGNMRPDKEGNIQMGGDYNLFYWLGLMHGHWEIDENQIDVVVGDKEKEALNTGIAVVIPNSKILEVLNCDKIIEERTKIEENYKKVYATIQDNVIINDNEENKTQSEEKRN